MTSIHAGWMLAGALALALPGIAAAAPGDLDTFGSGGIATASVTTSDDIVNGSTAAAAPYVTGVSFRGSSPHLFVAKLLANGTLDPAFGTGGRTMLRLAKSSEGVAVRVQADGKVVVVGNYDDGYGTPQMLVARFNADGSLDTTFASSGVHLHLVNNWAYGSAVAIQSDGKILAAGSTAYGSTGTYDMVVLRLNTDGSVDSTFGTAGVKTLDFRAGFDSASAVAQASTGKIIVAGASASGPSGGMDFAIARLNADGSLDTTFGPPAQNGLVLVDVAGGYDAAQAMMVDGAGAIFLGGTSQRPADGVYCFAIAKLTAAGLLDATFAGTGATIVSPGANSAYGYVIGSSPAGVVLGGAFGSNFAMARFTAAGALDATFGSGGIAVDADTSYSGMKGLYVAADGTSQALGSANEAGTPYKRDMLGIRYAASGARDATYGSGGKVLLNLFTLSWDVRAVAIQQSGRIVYAGSLYDGFDSDFAAAALTSNGVPDTGFGFLGVRSVGFGTTDDRANAMLQQADGSFILAGISNAAGTGSLAVAKLTSTGDFDRTFGASGRAQVTLGAGYAEAMALAPASNGRIVAAGYAVMGAGNYDFALVRFLANGALDTTFNGVGYTTLAFGAEQDVANAVAVQPDGKIVTAGYRRLSGSFDFAVARHNDNGQPDSTFGSFGKVTIGVGASNDIARAAVVLPTGKILVAGESFNAATGNDMAVVRLNANGSLDTAFGASGIALVNFAGGADSAYAMAVQVNDKIVLAGTASGEFALARLNPDGSRDTGFVGPYPPGGATSIDISPSVDTAYALALQRDGKLVSAGTAMGQWAVTRHVGDPRAAFVATDLGGDGKSDILYRNTGTGQVNRLFMSGASITNAAMAYVEPNTAWKIVGDGDFNGDGVTDLLWRNDTTGQVFVQPFAASGMPSGGAIAYTEPNAAWRIVHTPDFDGDGKADLLWWNSLTGQVYAQRMNGSAIVAQGLFYTEPNTNWRIAAVGDFSGSGKRNQLLWRNASTGQLFLMTVTLSGTTFSVTAGVTFYTEPNIAWKVVGAADFNGDGKTDILWRNGTTGDVYVMLMNGTTIASQGTVYHEPNLAWKVVAQGDYDGNGKADLLWRNETTGDVYMMLMNGLAIASQAMAYREPNTLWKVLGPWEYGQASTSLGP